jgi:hypothetical protein
MIDERDLVERAIEALVKDEPSFDGLLRRRERKQRNQRVAAGVVAVVVAAAVAGAAALGYVRSPKPVGSVHRPQGTIVFSRQTDASQGDFVFTVEPGGSARRLLKKGFDMFSVSPDGSQLLFPNVNENRTNWALPAVVSLDGSHPHLLRRHVPMTTLWPDAWSPDGTRFVGNARAPLGSSAAGLYTANSHGTDLFQVTSPPGRGNDLAIAYSPDGSKILFLRFIGAQGDQGHAVADLFTVNVDGTGLVRLNPPGTILGPWDLGGAGAPFAPVLDRRTASWSPDGRRVTFAAAIATPSEAESGTVERGLFVVNADGRNAHRIVAPGQILDAQWAPVGDWIAFSQADPDLPDIFVVHPDGTGARSLSSSSAGAGSWGPVWAPDGSALVFTRNGSDYQFASELWFVNVDGSGLTQLTHTPAEYFSYEWSSFRTAS